MQICLRSIRRFHSSRRRPMILISKTELLSSSKCIAWLIVFNMEAVAIGTLNALTIIIYLTERILCKFLGKNQKIVKETIHELITKQELPVTAQNLIITTPRTSCVYFKPKIHKPNNPSRPIVSACSCPTELISSYLDKIMTPIIKSLPSYIKDSNHALEIFRTFNFSGENKIIFTMDITSL